MSKVLVTGSTGMLGCHLVPHLRDRGYDVVELARTSESVIRADLIDARAAHAVLDDIAPSAIVNLAALTNVDECERSPQRAYLANVRIIENLAGWIRKRADRCHLVHVSTDQIYDGPGPHAEESVTLTNYYGFSKYAGELAAGNVRSTILRTNFFGASRCPGRKSLSDWLIGALSAAERITVFDDIQFSPLSLQTLVQHIERVLREPRPGVFNLGSREGMSKADFAFALAAAFDLPTSSMTRAPADSVRLLAYRPKDMRMDTQQFEAAYALRLPTLSEEIKSLRP